MGRPEVKPCKDHNYLGDKDGYASVWCGKKKVRLHRLTYARHAGVSLESMQGLDILHTCDNPRCIEPEHLQLGTTIANVADRVAKGRSARIGRVKQPVEIQEEIRKLYRTGLLTYKKLGERFNISEKTVGNIVNYENGYSIPVLP